MHHPVAGAPELTGEALDLPGDTELTIITYTVEPATPSAQALQFLAKWASQEATEESSESKRAAASVDRRQTRPMRVQADLAQHSFGYRSRNHEECVTPPQIHLHGASPRSMSGASVRPTPRRSGAQRTAPASLLGRYDRSPFFLDS
jgi:hypothetical protein